MIAGVAPDESGINRSLFAAGAIERDGIAAAPWSKRMLAALEALAADPDDVEALSFIDTEHQKMRDRGEAQRRPWEGVWALNRARLRNVRNVDISDRRVVRQGTQPRTPTNRGAAIIRTMVATQTANPTRTQVIPADRSDSAAIDAARLGDKVAKSYHKSLEVPRHRRRSVRYAYAYSMGYRMAGWDGTDGAERTVLMCDACGEVMDQAAAAAGGAALDLGMAPSCECGGTFGAKTYRRGAPYYMSLSPLSVLVDDVGLCLEEASWCIVDHHFSPERASAKWPGVELKSEQLAVGADLLPPTATGIGDVKREVVRIEEFIYRKDTYAPRGFRYFFHNGKVLWWTPEASADGGFPIVQDAADEPVDTYYNGGLADDLGWMDVEESRTWEMMLKIRDLNADPPTLIEEGMLLEDSDAFQVRPGTRVTYRPGVGGRKPEFMVGPRMSPVFGEILDRLHADMDFQAQQFPPARGQQSGSVTSAKQYLLLIEKSVEAMSILGSNLERGDARLQKLILLECKRNLTEEELLVFTGDDGEPEVLAFTGDKLEGFHDVDYVPGSSLPASKEGKREVLVEILKIVGVDAFTQRSVLEALDLGLDMPVDPVDMAVRKQRAEFSRLLAGEAVEPNPSDLHEAELAELVVRKGTKPYRDAPPARRAAVDAHEARHKQLLMLDQIEQMSRAEITRAAAAATVGQVAGSAANQGIPGEAPIGAPPGATLS